MTPQKPSKVTTTQPQVKNLSNTGSNVTILAIVAIIALVAGGALVLVRRRFNSKPYVPHRLGGCVRAGGHTPTTHVRTGRGTSKSIKDQGSE